MKDYTEIIVVIDRSGSMGVIRQDTIGGFNSFLEGQKKVEGDAKLSLLFFNTGYNTFTTQNLEANNFGYYNNITSHINGVDIKDVKPLSDEDYIPQGGTPLFDSVGAIIDSVGQRLAGLEESERPNKVLFVIMTDGEDTGYANYTPEKVAGMIKHQTDVYSWNFMFLGANISAAAVADRLNIKKSNSVQFKSSGKSMRASMDALGYAVSNVRGMSAMDYHESASLGSTVSVYDGFKDETGEIEIDPDKK